MVEEKKFPKVTAGALIVNKEGKVFLMRSPKFDGDLVVPGGHIEWGESVEEALKREVKEETALQIYDPVLIQYVEYILTERYIKDRHTVSLDFVVKTDNKDTDVKLEKREGTEYMWFTPEKALERDDIELETRRVLQKYIDNLENDNFEEKWKRALADYQNLQKETSELRSAMYKMSELQILEEFIPVYDNFKAAFNTNFTNDGQDGANATNSEQDNMNTAWKQGIEYIMKQFGEILKTHQVEGIKTVGEKVNLELHEVVGEEAGKGKSQTVVKEVQGGYKMGDRIIRPAKVIISK
jgi:nucleoside triphosphatase